MPTSDIVGRPEAGYRQSTANVLKDRAMRLRKKADALALLAVLIEKHVEPESHDEENLWSWALDLK